ncbi:MAG TPA: winged helix DNA-binding domain-containing protein [Bacteroidales bacterium]|nr:winged helix DNA-binding domain-containing protein [Bacteroidales bacterium]
MTSNEIAGYRMVNQQLAGTQIQSAPEMVKWFGAVQGQEYEQTKWGLGLRLPNLKESQIENELNDGKILRTHLLRPTWHFVHPEDIRWLLKITAPGIQRINAFMYRQTELDEKIFNRCNDILIALLQGGNQHTRNEINEEFKKHNIIAAGPRLSCIMMNAELEGIICSGARKGNQFTYALIDERINPAKQLNTEEALAEITRRYFMSRSPASATDFSIWSGLTMKECRRGIEMQGKSLQKINGEGGSYFAFDLNSLAKPAEEIFLLPTYDEYIMGYKNRDAIFSLENSPKVRPDLKFISMIIYMGQVIGTWKRVLKIKEVDLRYSFFKQLNTKKLIALKKAIIRFEEFYGMRVAVTDFKAI